MNDIIIHDTEKNDDFNVTTLENLRIYICGPTVYTASHIGHLKTYMTFDIIRRIFCDYFGLNVSYMMNITNVDDKIIKATYLQEYPYLREEHYPQNLREDQYLPISKFEEYADRWEIDFFNVMKRVNIMPPDILSRVTEYIDEILEFVEGIDNNGYAFEHDGSVYFNGNRYMKDTNAEILDDYDDNELNNSDENPKSKYNFVLLKKARLHEPGWESKWGRIRPGWHIECSAMASSIFGKKIDIHGGGIDLAFPHHHNELLQSNARFYPPNQLNNPDSDKIAYNDDNWVSHFMHTGHLNIKGLKMSRSLKNFITIDEALQSNSPDELRMLFLLHQWNLPMDYSDDTMIDAKYYVDFFKNFSKQIKSIMIRKNCKYFKKFSSNEMEYSKIFINAKKDIDLALRTNLNTSRVIMILRDLGRETFQYVERTEISEGIICTRLIELVNSYITKLLGIFGMTVLNDYVPNSQDSKEDLIKITSDIRTDIREIAKDTMKISKTHNDEPDTRQEFITIAKMLYNMTDEIRDQKLKNAGIELIDK